MADKAIRVGFVGAGGNCRLHHIPKLKAQPGVEIDWRDVIGASDVDAICIGTWPYMHAELTIAALEAGKHVLCEARMAMNAAEGRKMLEAARKKPNLVTQLVPGPPTLELDPTVTRLVAEGYVGDVLTVELQAT